MDDHAESSLRARMLGGEPFTYAALCSLASSEGERRMIERTIQKLRRAGLISYSRQGRAVVWRAVGVAQNEMGGP